MTESGQEYSQAVEPAYTCNGSPKGCERERFGGCRYHDSPHYPTEPTGGMPSSKAVEEDLPVVFSPLYDGSGTTPNPYGGEWHHPREKLLSYKRWLVNNDYATYEFEAHVSGTVRIANPAAIKTAVLWAAIAETEKVLAELKELAAMQT